MTETPRTTLRRWNLTPEKRAAEQRRVNVQTRAIHASVGPAPKNWNPWTIAEMEFVEEFADQPIAEVARALGRSYNAVSRIRRELGIARQNATYRRESELA